MVLAFPHVVAFSHSLNLSEMALRKGPRRQHHHQRQPRHKASHSSTSGVPNMKMFGFQAATSAGLMAHLTRRYTRMPSDDDMKSHASVLVLDEIVKFLKSIPRWHRKTWLKMLKRAFPEVGKNATLDRTMHMLVVRCWMLRRLSFFHGNFKMVQTCLVQCLTMIQLLAMA